MSDQVWTVGPHESLERAAQLMWEHDCGCVPIVDNEQRLLGVITDRDICMGAYTQGGCLREIPVHRCMSHSTHVCSPNDTLESAASRMGSEQVRRLPVVDENGHLVGILALGDLARTLGGNRGGPQKQMLGNEVARALSSISEPRSPRIDDVVPQAEFGLRARDAGSIVPRVSQPIGHSPADEVHM
jgi:predicted transcriptional regulator